MRDLRVRQIVKRIICPKRPILIVALTVSAVSGSAVVRGFASGVDGAIDPVPALSSSTMSKPKTIRIIERASEGSTRQDRLRMDALERRIERLERVLVNLQFENDRLRRDQDQLRRDAERWRREVERARRGW